MSQKNKGNNELIMDNLDKNPDFTNHSNNYSNINDCNAETPQYNSGNMSMISKQDSNSNLVPKNSITKEGTSASTITLPHSKKKSKIKKSTNSNDDSKKAKEEAKVNKVDNLEQEKRLEPIMEAPPLETIVKKMIFMNFILMIQRETLKN
jgi:hypothetical protein